MASPNQLPAQVGDTTNLLLKKLVSATQDLGTSGGIFLTEAEADALFFRLDGTNYTAVEMRTRAGLATTTTDNAISRYDGVIGATQDSAVTLADTTGRLGVPAGWGVDAADSIDFAAGGATGNITLTPSGTGLNISAGPLRVNGTSTLRFGATANATIGVSADTTAGELTLTGTTTGLIALNALGVKMPSTATAGLQLYNTADQVTNYERFSLAWVANVATFNTAAGGSGTVRSVSLTDATATLSLFGAGSTGYMRFSRNISTGGVVLAALGGTTTNSSGTYSALALTPTYNQASGTAANTDLLINRTETAVGSGAQYLFQAQVGGSDRFVFSNTGNYGSIGSIQLGVASAGSATLTLAQNRSQSAWGASGAQFRASTQTFTDTSTAGSGTAATAVFSSFARPTLAATNASVTTSDAATLYIANSPLAGTNQTLTRSWSLWVDDGNSRFDGDVQLDTIGTGVIIRSPDNARWRITVDNAGALVTTSI